jgi:hypothetical protein
MKLFLCQYNTIFPCMFFCCMIFCWILTECHCIMNVLCVFDTDSVRIVLWLYIHLSHSAFNADISSFPDIFFYYKMTTKYIIIKWCLCYICGFYFEIYFVFCVIINLHHIYQRGYNIYIYIITHFTFSFNAVITITIFHYTMYYASCERWDFWDNSLWKLFLLGYITPYYSCIWVAFYCIIFQFFYDIFQDISP